MSPFSSIILVGGSGYPYAAAPQIAVLNSNAYRTGIDNIFRWVLNTGQPAVNYAGFPEFRMTTGMELGAVVTSPSISSPWIGLAAGCEHPVSIDNSQTTGNGIDIAQRLQDLLQLPGSRQDRGLLTHP